MLIKKRAAVKASVEVIDNYIRDFDLKTKSICQVLIKLNRHIDYSTSFDKVQTAFIYLNLGHEKESLCLQFEYDHNILRTEMENLISKHSSTDLSNASYSSHTSS